MTEKDGRLIQSLRKRRDEYHIPLRKESWEKLETELLSRAAFRRRMHRWLSVAAAILVCLALPLPFLLKEDMPERVVDTNRPGNSFSALKQQRIVAVASTAGEEVTVTEEPTPIPINELPAEEDISLEEEEPGEPEVASFTGPRQERKTNLNYTLPATKKKRQSKWAFSLSAGSNNPKGPLSGQTGNELVNDPSYGLPSESIGVGDKEEEKSEEEGQEPGTKAYAFPHTRNQREAAHYNYRHRPPLSIGVSAQKRLGSHFGLESGLTYTYLYSDISEMGVSAYTGNQQLHYLGIPLKANWLLYSRERFSMYLSGGALVEYCLAANRRIGDQKEKLDFNRFQASLTAAAGMQFALTKPLSVFIEPGVSYFIANGSGVETIRTDNPLMFNLQAGIRFTY
ncbi:MAG: PorT family protein [Tannerellaceae bacterium]|jgi:hypothetical protein|nr:PorT family protein [Tannerellaceae bacterium]